MKHFAPSLIATFVTVSSLAATPSADAQFSSANDRWDYQRELLERQHVRAIKDLEHSRAQLMDLVRETQPVVRPPELLVEELVHIDREIFEANIAKAGLIRQVDRASARMESTRGEGLSVGQRLEIRRAEAVVERSKLELDLVAAELNRVDSLDAKAKGAVAASVKKRAQTAVATAELQLETAVAELEAQKAQAGEFLNAFSAELKEKTAELKELEAVTEARTIRAKQLQKIYGKCFDYQRLAHSTIPALEAEVAEIEKSLRELPVEQPREKDANDAEKSDPAAPKGDNDSAGSSNEPGPPTQRT